MLRPYGRQCRDCVLMPSSWGDKCPVEADCLESLVAFPTIMHFGAIYILAM